MSYNFLQSRDIAFADTFRKQDVRIGLYATTGVDSPLFAILSSVNTRRIG